MQSKLTYVHLCEMLGITTALARMKFVLYIPTPGDLRSIVSLLAPFDIIFEAPLMSPATLYDLEAHWFPKPISTLRKVADSSAPHRIYLVPTAVQHNKAYTKGGIKFGKQMAEAKKLNAYHDLASLTHALQAHRGFVTSSTLGIV